MTTPTLTIVLATYNGEKFLEKQLNSYLNQTIYPDELLIGDDGSNDKTIEIISDFSRKSPFPVRLTQNKNRLGYGDNFLNTSTQATTELVAFSDQDDIWLPEKIELSTKPFSIPDVVLCAHAATLINEYDNEIGSFDQGIKTSKIYPTGNLKPWDVYAGFTMVMRKTLLDLIPWTKRGSAGHTTGLSTAHDRWVYFLADSCGSTAVIPDYLALYRQHSNNQFGSGQSENVRLVWQPLNEVIERAEIYSEIAKYRANLLTLLAKSHPGTTLEKLAINSAKRWEVIFTGIESRKYIYTQSSRFRRLSAWLDNINSQVYLSPPNNTLSGRAVVKDFLAIFK